MAATFYIQTTDATQEDIHRALRNRGADTRKVTKNNNSLIFTNFFIQRS